MQIDNLVFSTTYKKVTEKLIIPGSIGTAATVFYTNVIKSLTAISTWKSPFYPFLPMES